MQQVYTGSEAVQNVPIVHAVQAVQSTVSNTLGPIIFLNLFLEAA
jgi:hypothetical protein